MGEEFIENNNTNHIIIRPSTVYGEEDNFFNLFGKMAKILPFLPLIKNGATRFQPIYVNDLSLLIFNLIGDIFLNLFDTKYAISLNFPLL